MGILSIMLSINAFATTKNDNNEIIDLSINHDFYSVGTPYRQNGKILICVEKYENKFAMWDPTDDKIIDMPNDCENTKLMPDDYLSLATHFVESYSSKNNPLDPSVKNYPIAFLNGAIYFDDDDSGNNCRKTISTNWLVEYSNKKKDEFYIAVKTKKPRIAFMSENCDAYDNNKTIVSEEFKVDDRNYTAIQLNSEQNIFYQEYSKKHLRTLQPVLLLFKKIPSGIWSTNNNVYVIPKWKLNPLLNESGPSIQKRYNSLMKAIKE